jgi:rhamnosyltransferase subunit B
MARIVLVTMGSWGDLFPYVGLSLELQQRGHDVVLAGSPAWEELVTDAGLSYRGIGKPIGFDDFRDRPEVFRPMGLGFRHALDSFLFDQIDRVTADLDAVFDGADLLVIHPIQLAALDVAEKRGLPTVVATVFPGMIPSAHTIPGGMPMAPLEGRAGRMVNRTVWRLATTLVGLLFDGRVNRHRAQLGLGKVHGALFKLPEHTQGVVVMAPEALIGRPPDWASSVSVTSFVNWDRGAQKPVPDETEQFLADGPPPVLITLGSSNAVVPDDFFELAVNAVTGFGHRALVVTGPAPRESVPQPGKDVHVTSFAPFNAVAPRCRAAIHHAGLGTTVSVLSAGIPQLVVPRGLDQPDTAMLLDRIGVGINVPWNRRRKKLQPALARLLADSGMAKRAAEMAEKLGGIDGAAATADAIEKQLVETHGSIDLRAPTAPVGTAAP